MDIAADAWIPESRADALSEADRQRADRVARRLHAELRAIIRTFPEQDRGASAMSRRLGVDRTTCHRAIAAGSGAYPGIRLLGQVPGVRGLRLLVEAMRKAGLDPSACDGLEAAIEEFEGLIRDLGGSQTRLMRRLEGAGVAERPGQGVEEAPSDLEARRMLFEAGRHFCGQSSRLSLATFVFRPTPGRPDRIDMAQIRGFLGHSMREDAMPFSVQWWVHPEEDRREPMDERYRTLDKDPIRGRAQGVLLEEFSTRPLPTITGRGPSDQRVLMIDPGAIDRPVDVVTANVVEGAQTHPQVDSPPVHEVWVLGRFPARVLLFDVLLHRSMARACIPQVGRYVISPALNESMERRWLDRFPGGPRLQLLEPDFGAWAHPSFARYPEVLAHLFDRLAWSPTDYVGFRCEVEYPQWGAGYCMTFDYARDEDEG